MIPFVVFGAEHFEAEVGELDGARYVEVRRNEGVHRTSLASRTLVRVGPTCGPGEGPRYGLVMGALVITIIGDDQEGLVEAVAGAIADNGGNWEKSHMAELAGKFAGIVLARIPDDAVDATLENLRAIDSSGLLDIRAERAVITAPDDSVAAFTLRVVGQDHAGIVHEIAQVLAAHKVSIEELETEIVPAPMSGRMFTASATLTAARGTDAEVLEQGVEAVAPDLMVEIEPLV